MHRGKNAAALRIAPLDGRVALKNRCVYSPRNYLYRATIVQRLSDRRVALNAVARCAERQHTLRVVIGKGGGFR